MTHRHNSNSISQFSKRALMAVLVTSSVSILPPMVSQAVAQSFQYNSVEVRGNARIASSTILSIAAGELGTRTTSAAQINSAVQRLFATGFFKEVDITPAGSTLVIDVVENPTLNRVVVEGNKRLKDEVLLDLITSAPRQTYSPSRAESDARKIAQAYAASGRIGAVVTPRIIQRSQNRVDLAFQVVEGNVTEVESITFAGNNVFSDRRLRGVISSKRAGIFRAFSGKDTLVEDRIEFDKQQLRDFYLRNGYIDFRVLSATSTLSRKKNAFTVAFNVQEGQQYRFGDVTVVSDLAGIDLQDFEGLAGIREGRTYDPRLVERYITRLETQAQRQNFPFVVARPQVTRNDDTQTLDIAVELIQGPRTFIERIDIEGNSVTLDKVIRRQFRLAEGDAFNQRSIQQAADRIRALDYFTTVDVQAREGSSPSRAVIDVNVEEKQTGQLGFGLGFNSSSGPTGSIEISQRNFLGRGQRANFNFATSGEGQEVSIGFVEPQFLDRDLSVGFELGVNTSSSSFIPIDIEKVKFVPTISFPTGEFSRLTAYYSISRTEIINQLDSNDVAVGLSPITAADIAKGPFNTSAIGLRYVIDKRNSPISPTAGYRLSFDQEFAGVGGGIKYSKTSFNFKTFRSLLNEDVILSAELEGGYLHSKDGGSNISNRFFSGGDQLRGFENYGLGPRDADTDDPVGGNIFAVARFEASFPIGIPEEYGIFGGLFFDVGTVWDVENTVGANLFGTDETKPTLRSAIGVSIFWDTAVGPLRFNFSKPIDIESYDKKETFQFTVDTRF